MTRDTDLDTATDEAWTSFRSALADRIASCEDLADILWELDVPERTESPCGPYVQVVWWHSGGPTAEVSSNRVLDPKFRIRKAERRWLRAHGWNRPDADHVNYWIDLEALPVDQVADMVVSVLRQVFGVVHPSFLIDPMVEADQPDLPAPPAKQLPLAIEPSDHEHLRELIDIALGPDWGASVPTKDEDGDIPYCCDRSVVFVRLRHDAPVIRVFAEIAVDVTDLESAAFEVAILNRDHALPKFVLQQNTVLAYVDIVAVPFVPDQLRGTIAGLCDLAPKIDADLARRVKGRRFLDKVEDDAA